MFQIRTPSGAMKLIAQQRLEKRFVSIPVNKEVHFSIAKVVDATKYISDYNLSFENDYH